MARSRSITSTAPSSSIILAGRTGARCVRTAFTRSPLRLLPREANSVPLFHSHRPSDAGDPQHPAAEGSQVRSERAPGEQSWGNTGIVLEVELLLSHAVATHGLARTIAACGAPSRSPPGFLA